MALAGAIAAAAYAQSERFGETRQYDGHWDSHWDNRWDDRPADPHPPEYGRPHPGDAYAQPWPEPGSGNRRWENAPGSNSEAIFRYDAARTGVGPQDGPLPHDARSGWDSTPLPVPGGGGSRPWEAAASPSAFQPPLPGEPQRPNPGQGGWRENAPSGLPAWHGPEYRPPRETLPLRPFEPAQIVAFVGDQPILAGDLLPHILQATEQFEGKVPQAELEAQRRLMLRQLLEKAIETKMVYLDFLRTAKAEALPQVQKQLFEHFDKNRLPGMIEAAQVANAGELDAILRRYGSSLDKARRDFAEQAMAQEMVRMNIDMNVEITHAQMLRYYNENIDDYEILPTARWEQLMVRFDRYPNKAAAYRAIAEMGNAVLRGASLAEVARRGSDAVSARDGGQHDWTTQGSLRLAELDRAIFRLPVGELSEILETEEGFHIVRVLERREASRIPFTEAQVAIREKLRREQLQPQVKAYLDRVRKQTHIWTIFDEEPSPGAAAPSFRPAGASAARVDQGERYAPR